MNWLTRDDISLSDVRQRGGLCTLKRRPLRAEYVSVET